MIYRYENVESPNQCNGWIVRMTQPVSQGPDGTWRVEIISSDNVAYPPGATTFLEKKYLFPVNGLKRMLLLNAHRTPKP